MNYLLEVVESGPNEGTKIGIVWIIGGVILLAMLATVVLIVINDKKNKNRSL